MKKMQILGKVEIQNEEKEIVVKEEDAFFKYYSMELVGAYAPQIKEQKIIFKKNNLFSDEIKRKMLNLANQKVSTAMWKEKNLFQAIGEINWEGSIREIVVKKEESLLKYYYLKLIGVYTPKMPGETIIFKQDTLENVVADDIKDNDQRSNLSSLEKEKIKEFLQQIKILNILDRIQVQERGFGAKTNYQTNHKIEKRQQEKEKKEPPKELPKKQEKIENKEKDINIKQEVDMNTRVTDMSNLEQVLEKNEKTPELEHGDEPLKMGIVESDEVKELRNEKGEKEEGHSSRFQAVVTTKQGKVKALDLENDTQEGTNPLEKNYQVKQDKAVKSGDVLTRLKVGEGSLGIEKGKYGEVEVYHSPRKTIGGKGIEGNKSLDRQLETSNAKNTLEGTEIETLKLAQEHNDGYRSVEEGYKEVEKHQEKYPNCEPKTAKDIDGDTNTQSHQHNAQNTEDFVQLASGEKVTYQELASRWGFYKDGKPDASFIKEKFVEKEQGDKTPEDIIQELDEEYEDPRAPEQSK